MSNLIQRANCGDSYAQFKLAEAAYHSGDYDTAFIWFEKAAKAGLAEAQTNLAVMYVEGEGCIVNKEQAFHWFKLAAQQGEPNAMLHYGLRVYDAGDYETAYVWLSKAAKFGLSDAQFRLGTMYKDGKGCVANQEDAKHWLLLAAQQGNNNAMHSYGMAVHGDGDYEEAYTWIRRAAEGGCPNSQVRLCIMACQGEGCTANTEEALQWLSRAAQQKNTLPIGTRWALSEIQEKNQVIHEFMETLPPDHPYLQPITIQFQGKVKII